MTEANFYDYFNEHDTIIRTCIFLHSCNLNNDLHVINSMMTTLEDTDIINNVDKLFIFNYGLPLNLVTKENTSIINMPNNVNEYENPTIKIIELFSAHNFNCKILYIHTKGVSHNRTSLSLNTIDDWRNYLLYMLCKHYKVCLNYLDTFDCVGCNFSPLPFPHFSGNFWWANSNYIKNMNRVLPLGTKHAPEWWLFDNNETNVKFKHLHSSMINHYHQCYPPENYKDLTFE
jgi:hypothetical protein